MNILYITNSVHLGGDTKCILTLCKEFKKKNNVIVASSGGKMLSEFKKNGIVHYEINKVNNKSICNIIKIILQIRSIIIKENIELIHSHHRMTTLLSKYAAINTKTKVIHTQHLCIKDKFRLTNLALKNIKVITVSEAAKRILIEKSNLKEENIKTIYNTIETECENKEIDENIIKCKEKGYFIVAQVSRIIDYKGVYDFIEIARKTSLECNNIKFFLIGEGPELDNINKKIKQDKLEDVVFAIGSKSNVIEHLKYIDVLLLCSYIEGLPLTPIEAFSQGVPVIATNIDGTNEEIEDGENGYLVDIKDTELFKERIIHLYNDREECNKISKNNILKFQRNFNKEIYYKLHEMEYK